MSIPFTGEGAAELLARHAALFHRASQGRLDGKQFVGPGGLLYSVGQTLRCVERELKDRGAGRVCVGVQPFTDLLNIIVQKSAWEREGEVPSDAIR